MSAPSPFSTRVAVRGPLLAVVTAALCVLSGCAALWRAHFDADDFAACQSSPGNWTLLAAPPPDERELVALARASPGAAAGFDRRRAWWLTGSDGQIVLCTADGHPKSAFLVDVFNFERHGGAWMLANHRSWIRIQG